MKAFVTCLAIGFTLAVLLHIAAARPFDRAIHDARIHTEITQ